MTGIVGFVGHAAAAGPILEGLRRLDDRSGDLAGIALIQRSRLLVYKVTEGVDRLREGVPDGLTATCGIGQIQRAASDRAPCRGSAQPQVDPTGTVAVVHHGSVHNAHELRLELLAQGASFSSDTDTEVLAHLIARAYTGDPVEAARQALSRVRGPWCMAAIFSQHPRRVVVAQRGSKLAIGLGGGCAHLTSDPRTLGTGVRDIVFLDDGDVGMVGPNLIELRGRTGKPVHKPLHALGTVPAPAPGALGPLRDRWAEDILDQPAFLRRTLRQLTGPEGSEGFDLDLSSITGVTFLGSGSSFHASCVGAAIVESLTHLPCRAERSSHFHGRRAVLDANRLFVGVSQSGETLDTLAALRHVRARGGRDACIVHGERTSIGQAVERRILLPGRAEPVLTSSRSFTAQIVAMLQLGLGIARARQCADPRLEQCLKRLPRLVERTLAATGLGQGGALRTLAELIVESDYGLFLGRGLSAAVAAQGAFGLSERTSIPTHAFSGGELRHCPVAMVGRGTPVVATLPSDRTRAAMLRQLAEVRRRGALIAMVHPRGDTRAQALADLSLPVEPSHPLLAPVLAMLPLQVLAYRTARVAGCDVGTAYEATRSFTAA